jgi:predicted ribosomally synthesized peptide with SipW-like signal peptide
MNTKIILSLAIIGAVAAIAVGGTVAYFTDTETSTGNTFTAGTIDIAVNSQNPWSQTGQYHFADMKPSQVEYSNFTINNVGTNPVNVWKKVDVTGTGGGVMSEPECLEQSGTWDGAACTGGQEKSDIDTAITYDLSVVLKDG